MAKRRATVRDEGRRVVAQGSESKERRPGAAGQVPLLQAVDLAFHPSQVHRQGPVFEEINMALHLAEVVALAGPNGCGKTTLLRCLAGALEPGESAGLRGTIIRNCDQGALAWLRQAGRESSHTASRETVWSRMLAAQEDLAEIRRRLDDGDWSALDAWEGASGYARERELEVMAEAFGVEDLLGRAVGELSPGQLQRVDLVAALVYADSRPRSVLLLDEPLNHLDLDGIRLVEEALLDPRRRERAAVLLVSHDRELLDRVADRTLLFADGELLSVAGGYSAAREHQGLLVRAQEHEAEESRRRIAKLEKEYRQRAGWAEKKERSKSGAGASKPFIAKRAKKLARRAKDVERRHQRALEDLSKTARRRARPVVLRRAEYEVTQRVVARFEAVEVSYGEHCVYSQLDLVLRSRDRCALLGPNGSGKSTLLRLLLGEVEAAAGSAYVNHAVGIGYLAQDAGEPSDMKDGRLLETFADLDVAESEVRRHLGSVGLRRERVLQTVGALSPGERMRAALVRLLLERSEFLVLDEPTNHLDTESIEVLEAFLREFPGGFLLVSHDRRLISALVERVLVVSDGRLATV